MKVVQLGRYTYLAYANLICLYATIVAGGYVASTNSGLACPDWPTCHGQIIPTFTTEVVIEYTHRLAALLSGVFFLGVTAISWLRFKAVTPIIMTASIGFALLVAQILLGMVTVQSSLQPAIVALHLGLATAVFGFALLLAYLAHQQSRLQK